MFLPKSIEVFSRRSFPYHIVLMNTFRCSSNYRSYSTLSPKEAKPFEEIPGPMNIPVLGSITQFIRNSGSNAEKKHNLGEAVFRRYGPIVRMKTFGAPWMVLTNNPEDAKKILTSTFNNPIREMFKPLKDLRLSSSNQFYKRGKTGIFIENGDEWWRIRSQVEEIFMKPKNIAFYLPEVDDITVQFVERIHELQSQNNGTVPDNFLYDLYKWSLECVSLVIMGRRLNGLHADINSGKDLSIQIIHDLVGFFKNLSQAARQGAYGWKYLNPVDYKELKSRHDNLVKVGDEALKKYLTEIHGKEGTEMNVLSKLLKKQNLSSDDLKALIIDLILAGVDTTAHCAGFTLYLLAKNPDFQTVLRTEITDVLGDESSLTLEHINNMPNVYRCLKESLRLFPLTVGTSRVLTEDLVLSGYKVPAGTLASCLHIYACKQADNFYRPLEFLPDRWRRDRPLGKFHPYTSLPFSHGKRTCLGKRIAEQELYTFIIRVLQKYSVSYEGPEPFSVKTAVFLKPDSPLRFKFSPIK